MEDNMTASSHFSVFDPVRLITFIFYIHFFFFFVTKTR